MNPIFASHRYKLVSIIRTGKKQTPGRLVFVGKPSIYGSEHLIEEIADVNVANDALMRKLGITGDEVADVESAKIERWERRIKDAAGTADR